MTGRAVFGLAAAAAACALAGPAAAGIAPVAPAGGQPPVIVAATLPLAALHPAATVPSEPAGWRFPAFRLADTAPVEPLGFVRARRTYYLNVQRDLAVIAGTLLALTGLSLLVRS